MGHFATHITTYELPGCEQQRLLLLAHHKSEPPSRSGQCYLISGMEAKFIIFNLASEGKDTNL